MEFKELLRAKVEELEESFKAKDMRLSSLTAEVNRTQIELHEINGAYRVLREILTSLEEKKGKEGKENGGT